MTQWTQDRLNMVRQMAAEGYTAIRIGEELGVSRSVILGKCHREGIRLPMTEAKNKERRQKLSASLQGRKARTKPSPSWAGYRPRVKGGSAYTDSEKLLVIASHMAGLSQNRACKLVGASPATYAKFWARDEALIARAKDILDRALREARQVAKKRTAERDARARMVMAFNEPILCRFGSRNADVIRRKLQGESLTEIGRAHGITRERARQILMKGIHAGILAPPGIQLTNDRVL